MTSRSVASSLSGNIFQSAHFTVNIRHNGSYFMECWHTELRFNCVNLLRLLTHCCRATNLKVASQKYIPRQGSWRARGVHWLPLWVQKWLAVDSRYPQNKHLPFSSNKEMDFSYRSTPGGQMYILPVRVWSLPTVTQPALVIQISPFQQNISLNKEKSGLNSGLLSFTYYAATDKTDA